MKKLINHIAIIMDGNGRWGTMKALTREEGHQAGLKSVQNIVQSCHELKIKHLTLYAFSKENWNRPQREVKHLMKLLIEFCVDSIQNIIKNNIKISVIGDWEALPTVVRYMIHQVLRRTQNNSGLQLNLAINYSGRSEIVDAAYRIISDVQEGVIDPQNIDESLFKNYLYLPHCSDPELLIRTGGEKRISNFLLWQLSFSKIYTTKTLWPDFNEKELKSILDDYKKSCVKISSKQEVCC